MKSWQQRDHHQKRCRHYMIFLAIFFYSKGWSFTPLEKVNLEIIQYQKFNRQSSGMVEETWDILCNSFPPGQAVLGNFGHFCTIREGVFKCKRLNNSSKSHFKTWIHRHDGMFAEKSLNNSHQATPLELKLMTPWIVIKMSWIVLNDTSLTLNLLVTCSSQ